MNERRNPFTKFQSPNIYGSEVEISDQIPAQCMFALPIVVTQIIDQLAVEQIGMKWGHQLWSCHCRSSYPFAMVKFMLVDGLTDDKIKSHLQKTGELEPLQQLPWRTCH